MAAGTPVVCLDLGGPGALVTMETGIKVVADDPIRAIANLALALQRLAADGALRARMGAAGRRHVADAYTWPRHGRMLDACYRAAVAGAPDRATSAVRGPRRPP